MSPIYKISGSLFLISLSCFGMEITENNQKALRFRVMTYNVCHVVGMADQPNKEHLAWSYRKDRIMQQVRDISPDIVGFQEIRDEKGVSAVADLWLGLGDYGYEIVTSRNSPSEESEINTIAYKRNRFALSHTNTWEVFDSSTNNYADFKSRGRRRSVLMLSLKPVVVRMLMNGVWEPMVDENHLPIHVVNVHNSLKYEDRVASNLKMMTHITRLIGWQGGAVVVLGDFNNTPLSQEVDGDMNVLKNNGYKELLNDLKTEKGIPVSGTFIGYSYDNFQAPRGKLGSQIDHIFMKILSSQLGYQSLSHVNLNTYNGTDNLDAETEEALLEGSRDRFPSDHVPGIADIVLYTKY